MAKAYNARCLVLKHTKLGETDVIVTMLAEDGRQIRAVAKGLRKPGNRIGARLELFAVADVLLHEGRSLDIVREARTVASNAGLRDGLERMACASVAAELVEKLSRDGALLGERMFAMSLAVMAQVGELEGSKAPLLTAAFLLKTMAMQGFAPAVRDCALCGNPIESISSFDIAYGGALCQECLDRLGICTTMPTELAAWIVPLVYSTFDELARVEAYPALELVDLAHLWVREHAGIELRSVAFLKRLILS